MALFSTRVMGGGKVESGWASPSEIELWQDGKSMHLKATGGGSQLWILTAYTDKNSKNYRLHFGALLEQRGE